MNDITFSFGENWRNFLSGADEQAIELAGADIAHWLGANSFENRRVLDVGCGSGLHSLAFHLKVASELPATKKLMIWRFILRTMAYRALHGRNPLRWNERKARGMDTYHDIVDWLGGLPYEVATVEELVTARQHGFERIEALEVSEAGCSVVTLRRSGARNGSVGQL
jgi:hypothetical protein